ncbi:unnamed protein product [Malus baccata var. baccata]
MHLPNPPSLHPPPTTPAARRGSFLHQKYAKSLGAKEGALKSETMHRKMEAEEAPRKRLDQEEKATNGKMAAEKPEEREAKMKEMASRNLKAHHPAGLKPHRKEVIDKKVDQDPKGDFG